MPLPAPVVHWMTLPARRVMLRICERGLVVRLASALSDPQGPMRLMNVIVRKSTAIEA